MCEIISRKWIIKFGVMNATENLPLEVVKTGCGFSPMPLGSVKKL